MVRFTHPTPWAEGGCSIGADRRAPFGTNFFPKRPAGRDRLDRLLRGEVPINRERTCARALAHVRAGPMVSALGFQGECAVVTGHLRARLVAGKTAFLDGRSAQRGGWKGLRFSHDTRNSCPTNGVDITRVSAMTCNRWPGPLLDTWTGLGGGVWVPGFRSNVLEHTSLAPSRKAVSGRGASRPTCFVGRAGGGGRPGAVWGSYFALRSGAAAPGSRGQGSGISGQGPGGSARVVAGGRAHRFGRRGRRRGRPWRRRCRRRGRAGGWCARAGSSMRRCG